MTRPTRTSFTSLTSTTEHDDLLDSAESALIEVIHSEAPMPHLMLTCYIALTTAQLTAADQLDAAIDRLTNTELSSRPGSRCVGERGQATTEYALVLLAAALVGLLVVAWATAGGGAARISQLFNRVIDAVISRV